MYGSRDLIHDASQTQFGFAPLKQQQLQIVWNNLVRFIEAELSKGQTVELPRFAKFSWKLARQPSRSTHVPFLLLADSFVSLYRIKKASPVQEVNVPTCYLDLSKFAIQCLLPRDITDACYHALIQSMGKASNLGQSVQIDFGICYLNIWDGAYTTKFKPSYLQRVHPSYPHTVKNPLDLTSSTARKPEVKTVRPRSAEPQRRTHKDNTYVHSQYPVGASKMSRETVDRVLQKQMRDSLKHDDHTPSHPQVNKPDARGAVRVQKRPSSATKLPSQQRITKDQSQPSFHPKQNKPVVSETKTKSDSETKPLENHGDQSSALLVDRGKREQEGLNTVTNFEKDDTTTTEKQAPPQSQAANHQGDCNKVMTKADSVCDLCTFRKHQLWEQQHKSSLRARDDVEYGRQIIEMDYLNKKQEQEAKRHQQQTRREIDEYNKGLHLAKFEQSAPIQQDETHTNEVPQHIAADIARKESRKAYARDLDIQIQQQNETRKKLEEQMQEERNDINVDLIRAREAEAREKAEAMKRKLVYRELLKDQISSRPHHCATADGPEDINLFARDEVSVEDRQSARKLMEHQMEQARMRQSAKQQTLANRIQDEAREIERIQRDQAHEDELKRQHKLAHRDNLLNSWKDQLTNKLLSSRPAWESHTATETIFTGHGEIEPKTCCNGQCAECGRSMPPSSLTQTFRGRRKGEITAYIL